MKIISALKPLSDDERKKMYAIVKDASELCKKKSKYAGNALYIIIRNLVLSAL